MNITLDQAEALVNNRKDMYWDGWTMVRTVSHAGAWLRPDGIFDRATRRWAVQHRYEMDDDGNYNIPKALGYGI